jgi:hypothetical protein
MLYLAYLLVTAPLLLRRLRGWPKFEPEFSTDGHKLFALGGFGVPLNALAVVWGIAMVVNLAWPRPEVYTPSGGDWWMLWAAPLFVLLSLAVGIVMHQLVRRRGPVAADRVDAEVRA